jgi:hypothetical protein
MNNRLLEGGRGDRQEQGNPKRSQVRGRKRLSRTGPGSLGPWRKVAPRSPGTGQPSGITASCAIPRSRKRVTRDPRFRSGGLDAVQEGLHLGTEALGLP